jgi:hypothetical protein
VSATSVRPRILNRLMSSDHGGVEITVARIRDLVTIGGPVLMELSMILTQSGQPGYNPLRDTISSMVWGPRGWIQTANFFLIAATMIGLASQLRPLLATTAARWGGFALFVIGVSFAILGIFPAQSPAGPKTLQAIIHGVTVYVIVLSFPVACFLLASAVRVGKLGRFLAAYSYVVGALGAALILMGVFFIANEAHWFGMLERVLLMNGFIWIEALAVYFSGGIIKQREAV